MELLLLTLSLVFSLSTLTMGLDAEVSGCVNDEAEFSIFLEEVDFATAKTRCLDSNATLARIDTTILHLGVHDLITSLEDPPLSFHIGNQINWSIFVSIP